MKIFKCGNEKQKQKVFQWLEAMSQSDPKVDEVVASIGGLVKKDGDRALCQLAMLSRPDVSRAVRLGGSRALLRYYTRLKMPRFPLKVTDKEMKGSLAKVSPGVLRAVVQSRDNIRRFHEQADKRTWLKTTNKRGQRITLGQIYRPVECAGLYVPGGTAPLVSTVLMTAVPARVAGVKRCYICTPASSQGVVHPIILAAARLCGVNEVYRTGGSQAVFAMAYGTQTIPRADKIAGPGNAYVAAALRQVQGFAGVESIPGPSEVMIVADESADPMALAMDLCSQAEHDERAVAVLVALSPRVTRQVEAALIKALPMLERQSVIEKVLQNRAAIIEVKNKAMALALANRMAAEHLEVNLKGNESEKFSRQVQNAGAILVGPFTPAAVSDYFAGPSHVLPTGGTARFSSGVTVDTFLKKTSWVSYNEKALKEARLAVQALALVEGLTAHSQSLAVRTKR